MLIIEKRIQIKHPCKRSKSNKRGYSHFFWFCQCILLPWKTLIVRRQFHMALAGWIYPRNPNKILCILLFYWKLRPASFSVSWCSTKCSITVVKTMLSKERWFSYIKTSIVTLFSRLSAANCKFNVNIWYQNRVYSE